MGKIKFISCDGYVKNTTYIHFTIEGGKSIDCIGDQVWISQDGKELEITDMADIDVINETSALFETPKAFKGALHRIGMEF